ncbi:multi antimicrobial extrusion protein MatE [Paenibacillus filicis]|uniref:Multi antimicrobial extrusion protein MatE n=1 Tax=Paenibacillus gyeongsangnamensis TaxID=3388067 RepID=A0ABT4Q4T2_9BACL|nr:multi antimicrobial extrusion protein MatE [Paenibacillus filicis]MCZ8511877.1 multi antimicrobial extrusion protein MatE [Paenibacillus filicis]
MSTTDSDQLTFRRMLAFFIPLGFSASLVSISHVIINSTLARSANPEWLIATYALPMSIMAVTERPALLLRQTCSVLVRDQTSFRAMARLTFYVLGTIFLMDMLIGYSPLGPAVFTGWFGAGAEMVHPMLHVYRVLMLVTVFSGIRCVFHGILISHMQTKWLTIGMGIRLFGMYLLSLYFIYSDQVTSGMVGAFIFLFGMMIEAGVSWREGRKLLLRALPEKLPSHPMEKPEQIFAFYKPMLYSSFLAVVTEPSINAFLANTSGVQLAVASFAIAAGLTELVQSFFSYIHQIVLNFYYKDARKVKRFILMLAPIPGLLIAFFVYTPFGPWFLTRMMSLNDRLMMECLSAMRVFMLLTFIFPVLDSLNGWLMLKNETRVFVWSQLSNVVTVLVTLSCCIALIPDWNAQIGALAQSLGAAAELTMAGFAVFRISGFGKNGFLRSSGSCSKKRSAGHSL